ncbi:SRPBCC family protein [Streptomyces morookaense]|uniref:SRPBCC family protein n=1 Tax=Streptomyces morookaense TaxID=1970 RepID=UPI00341145BB
MPLRKLRPVGPAFAGTAPLRFAFPARMAAAPEAVYRALADEVEAWPRWFGAVTLARPLEAEALGGREIRLRGGLRFRETITAADEPKRYAYRVDLTNAPGVRALSEEWALLPVGAGTVVAWTVAMDAAPLMGPLLRLVRPGVAGEFRRAVRALDRRLAAG